MSAKSLRSPGLYFIVRQNEESFEIVGFKFDENGGQIVSGGKVACKEFESLTKATGSLVGRFVWLTENGAWSDLLHGTYHVSKRTDHELELTHLDTQQVLKIPAASYRGRGHDYLNFGPAGMVEAKSVAGIEPCTLPRGRVRELVVNAGLLKE